MFAWFSFFRSNKQLVAKLWHLVHACHARGLFSIVCATAQGCANDIMDRKENGSFNADGLADNGNTGFLFTSY
jgi:hypothetical protein